MINALSENLYFPRLFSRGCNKSSSLSCLNSLFAVPTVDEIKPEVNNDSLFGSSTTQNEVTSSDVVTTNNVQVAVEEVKNTIRTYQDKGYKVTIEELDLDQEIQLIVKFNKN